MRSLKRFVAALCGAGLLIGCANPSTKQAVASAPTTAPTSVVYLAEEAGAKEAATQPALPAGHPDIAAMRKAAGTSGQLPAGHPSVGPVSGQGQSLPAGHPSIDQLRAPASTQPTAIGTLTIHAVQKTANGPAIAGDTVTVEMFNQEDMIRKVDAKLDEKGVAKIADVPFGPTFGQFIRVNHGGVEYTAQSSAVDDTKPEQEVSVNIYESTDQQPAWQIKMRHIIVQAVEGGVQVMDVLAVENPTDKSWLGTPDASGKRTTFAVALPAGATDVQLDGAFHEDCVKVEDGKIINSMAITPGVNKYQINYTLPVKNGTADLTLVAPALVKNLIIMVPDDGSKVSAVGLDGPSTVDMGGGKTRFFRGQDIPSGKTLSLSFGTPAAAPAAKKSDASSASMIDSSQAARLIAGGGGLLLFIVGGMFLFLKAPRSKRSK